MARLPSRLEADSSSSSSKNPVGDFEEPPSQFIRMLLQYFLPHASQLGFFLDPDRFYDRALLPLQFGDPHRPSPGLLCVVYLWGIHFSKGTSPPGFSEPDLLHRSRQYISLEISSPVHIEQTIQAQILLGTYLFRNKSLLQAELHSSGAATAILGYRLHQIRSARASTNIFGPLSGSLPKDAVEEGERIRGFWAVTFLQTSLCLTFNENRPFCVLESLGPDIDTPWPLEIADYHAGVLPSDYLGQQSIKHLLLDDSFPASPVCMLQAKASVFLYHVLRLPPGEPPVMVSPKMTSYSWLDTRISQFWQSLPPLHVFSSTADPSGSRSLALAHALIAAAAIKLHQRATASVAAHAQAKSVSAACGILECLRAREGLTVHPVVGALCALACGVLMVEVRTVRGFREAWSASMGTPMTPPTSEENDLVVGIRDGLATMAVYCKESSLMAQQFKLVQEQFESM
ncbi:hypothetical protein MVEN_01421200 [Mycena venus]|uniref:Transcription factor domain-containing protein n=1 Tax=Mycena venus TaxID=2733690 RepID=A0A8H7CUZ5_9AGAR|nr:hypothetical protein MVEN_01421200 [Mycena venus]